MLVDCQYVITSDGKSKLLDCASGFTEEQAEAIASAFPVVNLTIEIDDDWGFCRIRAVNGSEVEV